MSPISAPRPALPGRTASLGQAGLDRARVMICDDSAVIRGAIGNILATDPAIDIVARAANGEQALALLRVHKVDVVVLDIEMPVMDGLQALPLMLKACPGLKIIMASTLTTRGADIALRALRMGAADYLPKPSAAEAASDQHFAPELIAKVRGLARLRHRQEAVHAHAPAQPVLPPLRLAPSRVPLLLAIGSSTGGPNALFALVQSLRGTLPVPIVLTQHMPAAFTPILADHINKLGVLPCEEAHEGAKLRPGHILLARGDRHLLVRRGAGGLTAHLSNAPPENFCRPSVDPMLRSACEAVDGRVLVVMLTGMGQDGLLGAKQVVQAGGGVIAQDEATSVVWGMPGAVARAGLALAVLPLPQIGARIEAMVRHAGARA